MGKLHYCDNGVAVTDQVVRYKKFRNTKSDDNNTNYKLSFLDEEYKLIQRYFNNYKEYWYDQLADYLDREEFDADFDFRLFKAVETFDEDKARSLASTYGWTFLGMFNRWFYKILSHWKSNVKTSSFRLKKRPSVLCPVCGRSVPRITEEHLKHYKTARDLPSYVVWEGSLYEVHTSPKQYIYTWGSKTAKKVKALKKGNSKSISEYKHRTRWKWKLDNGERGVLCPFTKKIIPEITNAYLSSLDSKHNRHAESISWQDFIERYPNHLIQSEIYSLDYLESDADEEGFLKDHIPGTYDMSDNGIVCFDDPDSGYEHAFRTIEECIEDDTDQLILKLIAVGYTIDDISDTLNLNKKEVRRRLRLIRDSFGELEYKLLES